MVLLLDVGHKLFVKMTSRCREAGSFIPDGGGVARFRRFAEGWRKMSWREVVSLGEEERRKSPVKPLFNIVLNIPSSYFRVSTFYLGRSAYFVSQMYADVLYMINLEF